MPIWDYFLHVALTGIVAFLLIDNAVLRTQLRQTRRR